MNMTKDEYKLRVTKDKSKDKLESLVALSLKDEYKLRVTRDKSKNLVDSLVNLSVNGVDVGLQRIRQERLTLLLVLSGGTSGEDIYIIVPESRIESIPRYKVLFYTPEQLQQVYKRAVQAKQNRQMSAFLDIFYVQVNQVAEVLTYKINKALEILRRQNKQGKLGTSGYMLN